MQDKVFVLVTYVPDGYQEAVKDAVFASGAGSCQGYDSCVWQVLGMGQFRPLESAHPFIGEKGRMEKVPEWRLEFFVKDCDVDRVIAALKKAHPYEVPAYHLIPVRI